MKKTILILSFVLLLMAVSGAAVQTDQSKDDLAAFKEKVHQKATQMKANGASDEEINKFILEANKKYEAKLAANAELKLKMEQKIQQMKAQGATDEQIKEAMMAFKQAHQSNHSELKQKLEYKIQQMKAEGATDAQIEETIKAFKQKMAEQQKAAEKKE